MLQHCDLGVQPITFSVYEEMRQRVAYLFYSQDELTLIMADRLTFATQSTLYVQKYPVG